MLSAQANFGCTESGVILSSTENATHLWKGFLKSMEGVGAEKYPSICGLEDQSCSKIVVIVL